MARKHAILPLLLISLATLVASCGEQEAVHLAFTHGVASGDVTGTSVILWTRVDGEGEVTVEVAVDEQFEQVAASEKSRAEAEADFLVKASVDGLDPDSRYFYRFLSPDGSAGPVGTFLTAPADDVARDVVFAYSADSADYLQPFTLLSTVRRDDPAFFIYLGDTVIADPEVEGVPIATTLPEFRQLYKNNRGDEHLRDLMAATSVYAIWDDHEVVNDFAGETVDPDLMAAGRQAFFEYMPIRQSPDDPNRLYRSFRWGKEAELFILDERQYRSANAESACLDAEGDPDLLPFLGAPAAPEEAKAVRAFVDLPEETSADCIQALNEPTRTILGEPQIEFLKEALRSSDATWKFIVNEVPITQLMALPYDRWEGYRAERDDLLRFIRDNDIRNVVFLTTDLHGNIISDVRMDMFAGPEPVAKEVIAGPIARETIKEEMDSLLGAGSTDQFVGLLVAIAEPECVELDVYAYGLVEVDAEDSTASITIKDDSGRTLCQTILAAR